MKVVLVKDVEGLGFFGDVVNVKDGYAMNYLIPRGLALPATEGNIKHIQTILAQKERKLLREKKKAEELAKKLEGMVIGIKKPAGEGGKLFGSVTPADIVNALKEKGIEIERKNVVFYHPIKEVGVFPVKIRLHKDVEVDIKVDVKPEEK
ncbi:50S ribosomal protein L9 [Aquifex aeolicus]|uniref:Large ribosomal subunit protein bL9 n=1 Tax=Aquifex aeolicus (strain VF5) TaxID=224324 RepID=RL9_AQUAE|nr:50S ribosomal protein L9 [Aquifex aeolicus]O67830.1 RecName: Full=Large ribosomal subunit protein bL9; AltName: Full=50S ribosomal protein L9 [Aquifex aeolicus VF5]AAC07793.1 ribosomal protein L09 [Aquifex aeolicus VF5]